MPEIENILTSGEATNSKYPPFKPSSAVSIIPLEKDTYPLWRSQIVPYLVGQGVFGYLDGSIPPPPETIAGNNGVTKPNPDYLLWKRIDSLILTTIYSSLSRDILKQVYSNDTTALMWNAINTCFASQSKAKVVQLRVDLVNASKDTDSAIDFYMKTKYLADELKLAGHPMSNQEFLGYLLAGLGKNRDYEAFIQTVSTSNTMTLDDVYALLLQTDARFASQNKEAAAVASGPPAIGAPQSNYARSGHNQQSNDPNKGHGNQSQQYRGNTNNYRSWSSLLTSLAH